MQRCLRGWRTNEDVRARCVGLAAGIVIVYDPRCCLLWMAMGARASRGALPARPDVVVMMELAQC